VLSWDADPVSIRTHLHLGNVQTVVLLAVKILLSTCSISFVEVYWKFLSAMLI